MLPTKVHDVRFGRRRNRAVSGAFLGEVGRRAKRIYFKLFIYYARYGTKREEFLRIQSKWKTRLSDGVEKMLRHKQREVRE